MKSKALFPKATINGLLIYGKQLLFNETLEKKKDVLLLVNKLIEKIPDSRNATDYYQLSVRKKNKISKTIRNNYVSTKSF